MAVAGDAGGAWCPSTFVGLTNGVSIMFQMIRRSFVNFINDDNGPTAVEYAVMLALIIVVCIGAVRVLGTNASSTFDFVSTSIGS